MSQIQPFSWLVRLDVAPIWVADGFFLDNQGALDMLAEHLSYADVNVELGAVVVAAPDPRRIVNTMGWESNVAKEAEIRAGSPLAYPESGKQSSNIASTLIDAIALIGDPALGGVDAERRATMLTHLRSALALVDGTQSIVDFEWQNIE